MRTLFLASGLLAVSMPLFVSAQQPALLPQNLGIKYTRDSQDTRRSHDRSIEPRNRQFVLQRRPCRKAHGL